MLNAKIKNPGQPGIDHDQWIMRVDRYIGALKIRLDKFMRRAQFSDQALVWATLRADNAESVCRDLKEENERLKTVLYENKILL